MVNLNCMFDTLFSMQEFEDSDKQDKLKEEDMELTKSENMTLKRLIVAKDALLIQKSQTLENIKVGHI